MSQPYAYVRRMYGVDPVIGARVRHTEIDREGVIIRPRPEDQYVHVRLDGEKHRSRCHPTALDYSPGKAATS